MTDGMKITPGPTANARERLFAVNKQASDAWSLLCRLDASCARLVQLCRNVDEPTDPDALADVRAEITSAINALGRARDFLGRVAL